MMNPRRLIWVTLVFAFGALFGVIFAWVIAPVEYFNTAPSDLHPEIKDQYRALIAVTFLTETDIRRADTRIALLSDENPVEVLKAQAQRDMANSDDPDTARALALLAAELGKLPEAATGSVTTKTTPLPPTSSPKTPIVHLTELPTPKPSPTNLPTFVLKDLNEECDPTLVRPRIRVRVMSSNETPIPGVEIFVMWKDGQDHFFTGLKPEMGLDYGDFEMTPGIVYEVRMGENELSVPGIVSKECEANGKTGWNSWDLIFKNP